MEVNILKELYKDFLTVLSGSAIKYSKEADSFETLQMKKDADAYIKAYRREDTFNTYFHYDEDVIRHVIVGIDDKTVKEYISDRNLIPYEYREPILQRQRSKIVEEYVERNNYYRMLAGLPDIDEDPINYIYLDDEELKHVGVRELIPIHELDETYIALLEAEGTIDKYIKMYPEKKYLKFLGTKSIDIIIARTAKNFQLIRIPSGITEAFHNSFTLMYEQCREYFMSCIYITEYRDIISYYDNFIAMCIMVMTMQQVILRSLKSTIERDFFDPYAIKLLFSVYGVPYYPNLDSSMMSHLVQNLNLLIQNKGTNKVIYDISTILGFDRIQVYKYYLMKTRLFDSNGFPIERTKIDEYGHEVPDYKEMYDVYFQKAPIDSQDTYKNLDDSMMRVDYNTLIEDDPYWVDDAELQKELYESEYNFVETKYMSVAISYKLTNILFDNIYFLKMILEKKNELPMVVLDLPKISDGSVTIFDAVVIMCVLICKQNHLKGEILSTQSKIMHILGFNFELDYNTIREDILSDPYLDDSLVEFFKDPVCNSADKINKMYGTFLDLYDVLTEKMASTNDINVYHAYKKFVHSIYYTTEMRWMFNVGGEGAPKYPNTFAEYLQYTHPDIYDFIQEIDEDSLYAYSNHVSTKISNMIEELSTLGYYGNSSANVEQMLQGLIRFFKSYTTDLLDLDKILICDVKHENLIRLIDHLMIHKTIEAEDELRLSYADSLSFTSTVTYSTDLNIRDDIYKIITHTNIFDELYYYDKIGEIFKTLSIDSRMEYSDIINHMMVSMTEYESLLWKDLVRTYTTVYMDDKFSFHDYIHMITKILDVHTDMNFIDVLYIMSFLTVNSKLGFTDKSFVTDIKGYIDDKISFFDNVVSIMTKYNYQDKITFSEAVAIISKFIVEDGIMLRDDKSINIAIHYNDLLHMTDTIKEIKKNISVKDSVKIADMIGIIYKKLDRYDSLVLKDKWDLKNTAIISSILLCHDSITSIEVHNILKDYQIYYDDMEIYSSIPVHSNMILKDRCLISYI